MTGAELPARQNPIAFRRSCHGQAVKGRTSCPFSTPALRDDALALPPIREAEASRVAAHSKQRADSLENLPLASARSLTASDPPFSTMRNRYGPNGVKIGNRHEFGLTSLGLRDAAWLPAFVARSSSREPILPSLPKADGSSSLLPQPGESHDDLLPQSQKRPGLLPRVSFPRQRIQRVPLFEVRLVVRARQGCSSGREAPALGFGPPRPAFDLCETKGARLHR